MESASYILPNNIIYTTRNNHINKNYQEDFNRNNHINKNYQEDFNRNNHINKNYQEDFNRNNHINKNYQEDFNRNNHINKNYQEDFNRNNIEVYEYRNKNVIQPMHIPNNMPIYKNVNMNRNNSTQRFSQNNNSIKTGCAIPSLTCSNLGMSKNANCLNSFQFANNTNKPIENNNKKPFNNNNNNVVNKNNIVNKCIIKKLNNPHNIIQVRNPINNIPNKYEYVFDENISASSLYEKPIICNKNDTNKKNYEQQHFINTTNTNGIAYMYNKPTENKYVQKKNIYEIVTEPTIKKTSKSNKLDVLIKEKDAEIKKLEQNVEKKQEHKHVHARNNETDNEELKEKLLNQKIKYKEALENLKKVESDKKKLKFSLHARDKVLMKLENDINPIDEENCVLNNIKENIVGVDDVHNVFKYLHSGINQEVDNKLKKNTFSENKNNYLENTFNENKKKHLENKNNNNILNSEKKKKNMYNANDVSKIDVIDKDDLHLLKSVIIELEKENVDLKEENKNVNFKYENTFKTLSELRKDALEYMESIVSRDMRIAYLESMLQKCEKDLSKLKESMQKQQIINEEKISKLFSEIKILEKQSSHLQSMIHEKDTEIVLLKNEIVRGETLIKQYECRNKELQSELKLMCNNLENVIEASNQKNIFMNELEKQLRENEINRENAYLKEVAKNRRVHADMKFKEILYDKSVKNNVDELHNLKKELYLNNIHVQKAKEAFEILKNGPKTDYNTTDNTLQHNNTLNEDSVNVLNTCLNLKKKKKIEKGRKQTPPSDITQIVHTNGNTPQQCKDDIKIGKKKKR